VLSSILEDAVRYRLIGTNPARLVKRLKAAKPEGHYLEPYQVGPLLQAIPEHHRTHLRRSCCSLLFASGAQLPEVMDRMRHRDERMTLRVHAEGDALTRDRRARGARRAAKQQQTGNKWNRQEVPAKERAARRPLIERSG
jgi:site-specific recombinase XerD